MNTIGFEKLLLQTVFCCMASDGYIDKREIALIKSMFEKLPSFNNTNIQEEINQLISEINKRGKEFIRNYFDIIKNANLTEEEEITLIEFAIQTINADNQIEYSEIKFFKNIRHRLKVSDDKILERFPDIEQYLEQDIISEDFLEKISNQYFDIINLPQFDSINFFDKIEDKNKDNNIEKI